jgi:hypothetical protein
MLNQKLSFKGLKPKKSVMENLETQREVRKVYMRFVENGELIRVMETSPKRKLQKKSYP